MLSFTLPKGGLLGDTLVVRLRGLPASAGLGFNSGCTGGVFLLLLSDISSHLICADPEYSGDLGLLLTPAVEILRLFLARPEVCHVVRGSLLPAIRTEGTADSVTAGTVSADEPRTRGTNDNPLRIDGAGGELQADGGPQRGQAA